MEKKPMFYGGKVGPWIPVLLMLAGMLASTIIGGGGLNRLTGISFFAISVGFLLCKDKKQFGKITLKGLQNPMLGTILMAYLMAGMLAQLLRQSGLITALIWGISKLGMNAGWIDVYENKGKRGGAYSAGQIVHPYVLLNYKGTLDSEFTLAHEMGHAMHSYLSTKNQEPVDREYVIFVAEVASTCNESLLMQHLLKKTQDKKTRAYLINYFLEQFRTTLYRQTMFAEFELKINELVQNGGSLTAEGLNKIYHDLNVFYYGDAVVVDDLIDREWARIPHFYYNYYVFQYSTGFSAAMALSERILSEGEPAVKDYLNFLSGGCSKDPISLLQGAGVDMRTAEPVHRALKLFDSLLDEMEALMEA